MFFRYKLSALIILFIFILGVGLLNAAERDEQAIPVPTDAEQTKTEDRMMQGSAFSFTYYTSSQDATSIKRFYRNQLPNLGWKEKKLAEDLSQIKGFKMDASFKGVLDQNLIFEKDTDMLMINFLPAGFAKDGQTRFALSKGNVNLDEELPEETNPSFALLTKPKKDVAPTYPGAALIYLSEPEHALRATYSAPADIEQVISFYKTKMVNYGWDLTEEKPLEKVEGADMGEYDIAKHCPSCPKEATSLAGSLETWLAELNFSNQKGDTCNVVLSNVVSTQGKDLEDLKMTTILVDYAEKE